MNIIFSKKLFQISFSCFGFKFFSIEPMNIHLTLIKRSRMFKGFYDTDIRIIEGGILTGDSDIYLMLWMKEIVDDVLPSLHTTISFFSPESFRNGIMQSLFVERQWHTINTLLISCLYDAIFLQIGKHSDLPFGVSRQSFGGSTDENAWMYTHLSQFDNRMLQGLGFHFTGCRDINDRNDMDKHNIFSSIFSSQLPYSLDKMRSFDISYCTSYFYNSQILAIRSFVDPIFDFVSDMRNNLNGLA